MALLSYAFIRSLRKQMTNASHKVKHEVACKRLVSHVKTLCDFTSYHTLHGNQKKL